MAVPKWPHLDKWLRRYEQNTETRGSRKVVKNAKRGNKAKFDQIPYSCKSENLNIFGILRGSRQSIGPTPSILARCWTTKLEVHGSTPAGG